MPWMDGTGPWWLQRGFRRPYWRPCWWYWRLPKIRPVTLTREEEKKILEEELKEIDLEKQEIEKRLKEIG
ncbi:MAG: hypothetical protein QMD14_01550 [Candidatus Aenigmarchaeota archaeon]|nr:hypothetical protein [Candidatus Aenigmarchaeota archaeon]